MLERRADGYSVREELPMPDKPPYTAHLANLAFDAQQADINDFFADCEVTSVRIVEDKLDRKPKGFGYVEFGSLDGLKKALALTGSNLQGRQVRISVAEPRQFSETLFVAFTDTYSAKDRADPSRDFSDWSRKGPLPDIAGSQRRVSERPGGGFGRNFNDNMSDAGSERGGRRAFDQGDGKVRDFSNWERRGPLSPASAAPSLREGGRQGSRGEPGFRRSSPAWGEGRSQEGSRPPRREYQDKPVPERPAGASELDNQWRTKMRPDAPAKSPTPETSNPPSPAPVAAPASRPRLNLQKRTVSEAEPTPATGGSSDSKASPFGAARPVNTAAKEREVEEKRQLAIRQKREADEKAKADKAEEKRLTREKTESERSKEPVAAKEPKAAAEPKTATEPKTSTEPKEDEEEAAPTAPRFDILRRQESGTNDMVTEEAEEENEEEPIAEDKAVKPREIVRDSKPNGSWRKPSASQEAPEDSTTGQMEEEGWSTVSKPTKQRNNRRQNYGPSRAIAS